MTDLTDKQQALLEELLKDFKGDARDIFGEGGFFKEHGVRISMDGKGRWLDNVYVERLWRSLKQEEIYRHTYETVSEARKGIADYLRYFNEERLATELQAPDRQMSGR